MSFYRNAVWFVKGLNEYTKSGYLSASKRFDPADLDVNISNRSFMITGANSGLGRSAALTIAKKGATVHMVCRNKERGEAAQEELKQESGNQNIHLHLVDMSKPRDVIRFSETFKSEGQPLNVLINNAGILVNEDKRQVTEDGLESTFATNTLGTHLLTIHLLPVLEQAEDPRVVIVTSGGMLLQKLDLSDLQFEKMSKFDGAMAYSQTKRQQVVMTAQYAKTYPKVHFSCPHPGWSSTPGVQSSLPDFYERFQNKLRSEEAGADTIVWLAISPAATKQLSGLFFQDRKPVPIHLPLAWTKSNSGDDEKLMTKLQEFAESFNK
ncbi:dehydrogenase/reductase SDR family member 12 isoform X1 [Aplysia californica]|uniref:Dehydrogenase/reductase SDR family member 12 isoform X1 n=1 Tax=Aplysia californica TaxID=6500 RepID=A0ABM0K8A3_APLCA|nr:dehydrogenase/reductase SDR family member 12 isoform X1 [Aplysia californica]